MRPSEAQRVVESLRKGIPPDGYVRQFTVGRASEIAELEARLRANTGGALLLQANYGAGKTHLLRFIRETALEAGYVVSLVSLDAKGGVRFNRMDQILGAICRQIEVPGVPGKGVGRFLDRVCESVRRPPPGEEEFWQDVTDGGTWSHSDELSSPAVFVALRAWCTGEPEAKQLAEAWLFQPWVYSSQRRILYCGLVEGLRRHFRDPRREWMFYDHGVFLFNTQGYQQCWSALRDLHRLAKASGHAGFIILFDEYEDVVTNLLRVNYQEAAFWNLFQFYSGKKFPGMTFYAVTPDFSEKCKHALLEKGRYDFDYAAFDRLPTFRMSPLSPSNLLAVARKIADLHGTAYEWSPLESVSEDELRQVVYRAVSVAVEDRVRQTIRQVVSHLDGALEAAE